MIKGAWKGFNLPATPAKNVVINKTGQTFDSVIIDAHNLTSSATVKIQANATDVWTSPTIDITVSVKDTITYLWDTTQSFDYVRLVFEDSTNTSPIFLGMVFLANAKSFCIRDGFNINQIVNGRAQYQTFDFALPYGTVTERAKVKDFITQSAGTVSLSITRQQYGTAWPFYVILIEDDLTNVPPIYSLLSAEVTQIKLTTTALNFDIGFGAQEVN